jgi:hypothetical protein
LLVLDWWEVSQGRVQVSVVVRVDPASGGVLDVGDGLVRPSWKTVVRMHVGVGVHALMASIKLYVGPGA